MNTPGPPHGAKSTQHNFSYLKSDAASSPAKANRREQYISLRRIIGTTTTSVNGFDCLPDARTFAYVAGNASVVARVDEEFNISQRFFRARPTTPSINQASTLHGPSALSPAPDSRNKVSPGFKDAGLGLSPRGLHFADWADSPSGRTLNARERTKAATCLSLSPNSRFLAVGETGYKPRVLIFPMAEDAYPDQPLAAMTEHAFGVHCVAFSPDSQFLASLGTLNDGFLHIWQVNQRTGSATLYASNKCTSTIKHMAWIGTNLITVGLRHVKVWRVADEVEDTAMRRRLSDGNHIISIPVIRTLAGRNCLLGSLLESTFSLVVPVSPSRAIVCSEKGDICLLDNSEATQQFTSLGNIGFGVSSASLDAKCNIWFAGYSGELKTYNVLKLCSDGVPSPSSQPLLSLGWPLSLEHPTYPTYIVAMGSIDGQFVSVDSQCAVMIHSLFSDSNEMLSCSATNKMHAHRSPILGVQPCQPSQDLNACFYTWSADGLVLFWNSDGSCTRHVMIPLEQPSNVRIDELMNELKVVCAFSGLDSLASGDRYGAVRITSLETQDIVFDAKAHASEVTDITVYEISGTSLLACSGRDRMVQLFKRASMSWEHVQTLDNHTGAVTGVLFSTDGSRLFSYSSDRTIVVTECVSKPVGERNDLAFRHVRTITLKATPTAITLHPERSSFVYAATLDRQIIKVDVEAGKICSNFKASDFENVDAVVISGLVCITTHRTPLLGAISSTDKSLRLYAETGSLLVRDHAHTEGISGVALVNPGTSKEGDQLPQFLATVALDGTIFLWDFMLKDPQVSQLLEPADTDSDSRSVRSIVASRPTLRRVLSQSELAQFGRSADEALPKPSSTPSELQSPQLRKKASRVSLARTSKMEPSPLPRPRNHSRPRPSLASPTRRKSLGRSPSPGSPANKIVQPTRARKSSLDVQTRARAAPISNEFGSLNISTDHLSRTLRAYRKKLASSPDNLKSETLQELERELGLTARALGEKAAKTKGISETTMVKLLDQYSERLVDMVDEKIAATVARQVMQTTYVDPSSAEDRPATT